MSAKNVSTKTKLPKIAENDAYLEPFASAIQYRINRAKEVEDLLTGEKFKHIADWAQGHKYYGLHKEKENWLFREWAPNATAIYIVCEFTKWQKDERFRLKRVDDNGTWEVHFPVTLLKHLDWYKLHIEWQGGSGERIPSYANYVVQDETTKIFCARVWDPPTTYKFKNKIPHLKGQAPLIYEGHIGMAQIEGKVSTYEEFRKNTLPRIKAAGYNTLQIMAIPEHPYYGSFGYQVSNFFAPSSRFGTPEELKALIDEAHGMDIQVVMDLVHSHAVKNEVEGLGAFDGTRYQYFHDGGKGVHPAWDTYLFDYGKPQVMHFLLSNCRYWIEEFKFDGFRFDGVTSMLYHHHGLGAGFSSYHDYFNMSVDVDAVVYFILANKIIHKINPQAITIAEDVSGMPGLSAPQEDGGIGFDYRMAMGIADYWIKLIKEIPDEKWSVDGIFWEMTNRRQDEKVISYAECHDQALVGDKTIMFRLADAQMYWNMSKDRRNLIIDRAIALHKMIRLITLVTGRGGYLNFMGNEFGHPEWIDFPREGNGWSYHCARRQWHLRDDQLLCYHFLGDFDQEIINFAREYNILSHSDPKHFWSHCDDHTLGFERAGFYFFFNFDANKSFTDYKMTLPQGRYKEIFNSDETRFGGTGRLIDGQIHETMTVKNEGQVETKLALYLPTRTALVLQKID